MSIAGFAYVLRCDNGGKEFLAMHTFGTSRTRAQSALNAMNHRRVNLRKPPLEVVSLCAVSVAITDGQPPATNAFVAPGSERFETPSTAPA